MKQTEYLKWKKIISNSIKQLMISNVILSPRKNITINFWNLHFPESIILFISSITIYFGRCVMTKAVRLFSEWNTFSKHERFEICFSLRYSITLCFVIIYCKNIQRPLFIFDYSLILFEIFFKLEVMAFIKSVSIKKKHSLDLYSLFVFFSF
jgi:hypothetical protein